jgi:hypothetical protein
MANEWDRARAQKRGGGQELLPLNTALAEDRYQAECSVEMAADFAFDRQWAITLLDGALTCVRDEHEVSGKREQFKLLRPFLTIGSEPVSYREVALQLGVTETAARMAVHRLRLRYRQAFREVLAQTVSTPAEVDAEMLHLLHVLSQ